MASETFIELRVTTGQKNYQVTNVEWQTERPGHTPGHYRFIEKKYVRSGKMPCERHLNCTVAIYHLPFFQYNPVNCPRVLLGLPPISSSKVAFVARLYLLFHSRCFRRCFRWVPCQSD